MTTRIAKRWTPQDLESFHKFHGDIKEDVMRRAARQDSNQPELVLALRKIGAKVYHIGKPLDLLIGYRGKTLILECKRLDKKGHADEFTKEQRDFLATWPGQVDIVYTIDEAISAVVNGSK